MRLILKPGNKEYSALTKMDKILEGDHYAYLESWIENEDVELPEEMAEYVKQLEYIRSFFYSGNTLQKIKRKMKLHFPDLSLKQINSRLDDAQEYFYLNHDLKKDTYRHIHYEKQMQCAELVLRTAKTPIDIKIASDIYKAAEKSKQLHLPDKEDFPAELLEKRTNIFSLQPEDIGLPARTDDNLLKRMMEEFNIEEAEKLRIQGDAGIGPRQVFDYNPDEDGENEPSQE